MSSADFRCGGYASSRRSQSAYTDDFTRDCRAWRLRFAQEKKAKSLQLKDLPAAVQRTVQANLNAGEIKNIAKEKEDGVDQYEVESVLNGKTRDFNVDLKGNLLVIEEGTTIDAIPAPAKTSILKKVTDGKLGTVETFTKTGLPMMYEAAYTDKQGKAHEVLVKADGTEVKE